jgi:hypothetical protein
MKRAISQQQNNSSFNKVFNKLLKQLLKKIKKTLDNLAIVGTFFLRFAVTIVVHYIPMLITSKYINFVHAREEVANERILNRTI